MRLSRLIADAIAQAAEEGRLVEIDQSTSEPIPTPVEYRPLAFMSSKKGPLPLINFTKKDLA